MSILETASEGALSLPIGPTLVPQIQAQDSASLYFWLGSTTSLTMMSPFMASSSPSLGTWLR